MKMATCENTVDQYIPNGFDYKVVTLPCGSTGIDGQELRCEKCSKVRPWYMCEHGVDHSGDGDCLCAACELGE